METQDTHTLKIHRKQLSAEFRHMLYLKYNNPSAYTLKGGDIHVSYIKEQLEVILKKLNPKSEQSSLSEVPDFTKAPIHFSELD